MVCFVPIPVDLPLKEYYTIRCFSQFVKYGYFPSVVIIYFLADCFHIFSCLGSINGGILAYFLFGGFTFMFRYTPFVEWTKMFPPLGRSSKSIFSFMSHNAGDNMVERCAKSS